MIDLKAFAEFEPNPPATREEIRAAENALATTLPRAYADFLSRMNGGEGFVGGFYLVLWKASDLAGFNKDYGISTKLPWALLFGGNGGGEALAFNRDKEPWRVVLMPLIGADMESALPLGESFENFLERLANSSDPFAKS